MPDPACCCPTAGWARAKCWNPSAHAALAASTDPKRPPSLTLPADGTAKKRHVQVGVQVFGVCIADGCPAPRKRGSARHLRLLWPKLHRFTGLLGRRALAELGGI